ncbi:MAG: glycosyltransferase family 4 protein [Acidimicrobiales bacterium]|jgi:glycosyltransferase involved in cell wall biosynthesis
MRIMIVAPPWLPVPPPAYGGTEAVLDGLARGLHAAGHDVLLFTTGESTCPVERRWVFERAIGVGEGGAAQELRHVVHAYEIASEFDVVHDHTLIGPLYSERFPNLRVVTTNHGPFESDLIDLYRIVSDRVPVIAISRHQASGADDVPIAAIIHHGVEASEFPVGDGSGGYALFLGRMNPGKGAHVAAHVAREAGIELHIAGKCHEQLEIDYFESTIRPLLSSGVDYLGEVDDKAKLELLGAAKVLLNPISWPEPFGMVMIEALACGTPVITTPCGAAPEIVDDGVTGFVRAGEPALVDALSRIEEIDRRRCRDAVLGHFSRRRMVDEHVDLYRRVVSGEW